MRPESRAFTLEAPAKINLRLRILARERLGFHSLETVFCAISLADTVTIRPGEGGIDLDVGGGIDTGPLERNLVVRAATRFYDELGRRGDLRIELRKRIPSSAGLGGGSSDAAATLRLLNHLHGEPFPREALMRIGGQLGSDIPFFLGGSPLAVGWSRGERLLTLPALPERAVLIAHPGVAIPTREAFERLAELRGAEYRPEASVLPLEGLGAWSTLAALACNDFDAVAAERIPIIPRACSLMRGGGAEITLLAGSGGSIFGIFRDAADAGPAGEQLRELGFSVWPATTLSQLPSPRPAEG